jgi:peptidyl-prolyl cis-trans isomerase D
MFDFVRKHTKIMMILLFLLIIPAFVLVGMEGFRGVSAQGETVAKVGSQGITEAEWDAVHKAEVERLRAQMPNIDPKILDSAEARYASLDRLVRDKVLALAVKDEHLSVTDAKLATTLQQNSTIASLRGADGKIDMERYRQIAASQGLTPEGFEARIRADIATRQVESGIAGSAFTPNSLADVALNAYFERRDVQVVRFTPKDFASKVTLTDSDLEAFYQSNPKLFQSPESANIEYVVLDIESIKKTITLKEQDLKDDYANNFSKLNTAKEERRASHILINAPKDMPSADRKKARERAEALLAEVNKAPQSFPAVARKNSQDTGSAPNGGDLDFFVRGAMVKPFEEAVFSMKKGDISDVVESDFGFHIIKLTDIRAPKLPTFEEIRSTLESNMKTQEAQRKFLEVADTFTNAVYEQSDALKPVAERLKLEVKTANNVQRKPAPGALPLLANPKFLNAVFSPDSIEKKRNTEAVEVAPNQLVAARIIDYTPATTRPLAEVRSEVQALLTSTRSAALAKAEGEEKLAGWKAAANANLPGAVVVSRAATQGLPRAVVDALLRAETTTLPAWLGVDLAQQGYAVVRINKVLPPATTEAPLAAQQRSQFAQGLANAETTAFYNTLKDRYKVQIKALRPVNITASAE